METSAMTRLFIITCLGLFAATIVLTVASAGLSP